ncbi:MAG: carbohydrate kinase family protein [Kiritimatiellia bacterium]|jgi:sugar/nucleoside kinase (ribokinase family)
MPTEPPSHPASISPRRPCIVVAGHVCLDVIPTFKQGAKTLGELLVPGKLVDVGPAVLATGGAVANTGLALHRLGVRTRLVGKLGQDSFGDAICGLLRQQGATLADHMIRDAQSATSYSIVINPPGIDRVFLHCPGANDTFSADDLPAETLDGADLLHFGYPPLMQRFYTDGGEELARLLAKARAAGLTTSLDLALPDPDSPAGQADWLKILARTLPEVDVFCPSFDEILFMLRHDTGLHIHKTVEKDKPLGGLDANDILAISTRLIELGAGAVFLKLGRQGAFLRVTEDRDRLAKSGRCAPTLSQWLGATLHAACFTVEVAGTTGAGDCSIAGLLAAILRGEASRDALRAAVATGAASVERPDATSGIPDWSALASRLACGWPRDPSLPFPHSV